MSPVKLCTACSRLICFRMVDRSESEHLPQQQEARRGDLLFRQMGVYWSIIMRLESTSRLCYFPSLQKKIFPFLSAQDDDTYIFVVVCCAAHARCCEDGVHSLTIFEPDALRTFKCIGKCLPLITSSLCLQRKAFIFLCTILFANVT